MSDATSFEELAAALRQIEVRVSAVQHSLHANQDRQRDMLGEVCRDLQTLFVNVGGGKP